MCTRNDNVHSLGMTMCARNDTSAACETLWRCETFAKPPSFLPFAQKMGHKEGDACKRSGHAGGCPTADLI